ncbi:TPA: hypothetical protein IGZ61_001850 [Escherichia coli]|nr:hypothetical protein [Escherichia coli]
MDDNTPQQPTGFWGYLFDYLRQIKSIRQVLITLLLAVGTIAGGTVWEYRRELTLAAVSRFGTPEIDSSRAESVATELMRTTGAKTVSIWSVSMQSNERTLLYFRQGDIRLSQYEGVSDLAFQLHSASTDELIRLINHEADCYPSIVSHPEDVVMVDPEVTYVCSASIPPAHGIFLGFITAGFYGKPARPDYIKTRLASAAQKMMK